MSRKLKLGDFLVPAIHSPVRMAIYNWLWHHADQDAGYITLGRAAWGDWGATYAETHAGRKAIAMNISYLRERIAATKRDDAPVIEPVRNYGGYRLTCSNLAIWGPMRTVRLVPRQRKAVCPKGHTRELIRGAWACRECLRESNRQWRRTAGRDMAVQP